MLTHTGTKTLETQRLTLRKFNYDDCGDMLKYWVADPDIQKMYCEPVYKTKDEVKGLLDQYIGSYKNSDYYRWAVILKSTGECIGQTAFFLVDSNNHFSEMEYCIGKKFQKCGYATEAAKAIISFGFSQVNFHKIQICHNALNTASKRVIEKCGFKYEGTLRDFFYFDGKYADRLYYSILKKEWQTGL